LLQVYTKNIFIANGEVWHTIAHIHNPRPVHS